MDRMETVSQYVRSVESRIVGRVFTYGGRLHFVLEADRESGLARLSCRYGTRTDVVFMPVTEVMMRLEQEGRKQGSHGAPELPIAANPN
jgi:hypothetical protein